MDLTKVFTVLKTIYSLLRFAKRVKKEFDETETNEPQSVSKDVPKKHGRSKAEQSKSA